jgi:hypothetical protein
VAEVLKLVVGAKESLERNGAQGGVKKNLNTLDSAEDIGPDGQGTLRVYVVGAKKSLEHNGTQGGAKESLNTACTVLWSLGSAGKGGRLFCTS